MPIKSFAEACQDPQIVHRNMVVELEHPKFGKVLNVSSPIKYSRTPLYIRSLAPKMGQDTADILLELGYTSDEIRDFKRKGLI